MNNRIGLGCSILAVVGLTLSACGDRPDTTQPRSTSGVTKATVSVETGSDGLTAEQRNVGDRLKQDNKPGAIKYLYIISAYSGQVLIQSTVRGKVTSSGKRLTPTTVAAGGGYSDGHYNYGIPVNIGGETHYTGEVLQDDGTYGSSDPYLFWWDVKGIYHQQYISGGVTVTVSDQPIAVHSVVMNFDNVSVAKPE